MILIFNCEDLKIGITEESLKEKNILKSVIYREIYIVESAACIVYTFKSGVSIVLKNRHGKRYTCYDTIEHLIKDINKQKEEI